MTKRDTIPVHLRLDRDIHSWLLRATARKRSNLSAVIREILAEKHAERHK